MADDTNMNLVYRTITKHSTGASSRMVGSKTIGHTAQQDSNSSKHDHNPNSAQHCNDGAASLLTSIKGVIFDMDGTLTLPILDFKEMRRRAGIPQSADILVYVNSLEEQQRNTAFRIIEEMEQEANQQMKLQPGVVEVLSYLAEHKIEKALITRNTKHSVSVFLDKLQSLLQATPTAHPSLMSEPIFSQILPRDFQPHKPHPAPVEHVCKQWCMDPASVMMIGDDKTDVISGNTAGTVTGLLLNPSKTMPENCPCDVTVRTLHELLELWKKPFDCYR